MKLSRFLLTAALGTMLALAYVHQNIEIIKASYVNRDRLNTRAQLLDQNKVLAYNINRLRSAGNLERELLAGGVQFELPLPSRIVRVIEVELPQEVEVEKRENRFFSFFALRTRAEAETTEPERIGAD